MIGSLKCVELSEIEIEQAILAAKYAKLKKIEEQSAKEQKERESQVYSPGPWRFAENRGSDGEIAFYSIHTDQKGFCPTIASTWSGGGGIGNARLIAAAPELLDAMETILAESLMELSDGLCSDWGPLIAARAAIAKARGTAIQG